MPKKELSCEKYKKLAEADVYREISYFFKARSLRDPNPCSHFVNKPIVTLFKVKEARINIRLANSTLNGLKARAEEAGMPYQTLAASVLHQVAMGDLRLKLVPGRKK
ncbi:MAG: CopG family antitoxin [Chthoniobacterales bacterium]